MRLSVDTHLSSNDHPPCTGPSGTCPARPPRSAGPACREAELDSSAGVRPPADRRKPLALNSHRRTPIPLVRFKRRVQNKMAEIEEEIYRKYTGKEDID
ncbi:hypothetical protein LSAT2_030283 [Lamellibrachia satsuma]|nr:hypothetical protein LSAT2_030283 [Lamellibrachia satsuma]